MTGTLHRFGGWSFAVEGDELFDVRWHGDRVLVGIRGVIRDHDWRTVPVSSVTQEVDRTSDRLQIRIEVVHEAAGIRFRWNGTIVASARALSLEFSGAASAEFSSNRVGLTVLHALDDAGRDYRVTRPDGSTFEAMFPERIAPHQPVAEIAGLGWRRGEVGYELQFTGETFETEDQRNWTDASFKTYARPLADPFPFTVATGERVNQAVVLTVTPDASAVTPATDSVAPDDRPDHGTDAFVLVEVEAPTSRDHLLPAVGALVSPLSDQPGAPQSEWRPSAESVLVELHAAEDGWRHELEFGVASAAGRPLDVRIVAATPADVIEAVGALPGSGIARVGVFDTATHVSEPALWEALVAAAGERESSGGRSFDLVGGTRAHYTELNRTSGRLPDALPALVFSMTPTMHAVDTRHVVATLETQAIVIENARALAGSRPIHVGPITVRPRFNAVATSASDPERDRNAADDRQSSELLAAWTIASASALAVEGVASISWYEEIGARGVRGTDGIEFPVARALRWIAELSGKPRLRVRMTPVSADGAELSSTSTTGVWVLAGESEGSPVVLAANLAARARTVHIRAGWATDRVVEVTLEPFAIARIRPTTD